MNHQKIGQMIYTLRKEQGMTQRELAERLHVGAKTISKWERGQGCPDVSLLQGVSEVLQVTVEQLLAGELPVSRKNSGNMSRIAFYLCPHCGNILTGIGSCGVICCGRRLKPTIAKPADESHRLQWEVSDGGWYVTGDHPMDKQHYLQFAALVNHDRMELVRLYPEQDVAFRLGLHRGTVYYFCSEHGLFQMKI